MMLITFQVNALLTPDHIKLKVLSWRNKIETDIREVLQTDSIFVNVSKGMLASNKELLSSFGTTETLTVCSEILNKGELQVSEQERGALYETVFRDVASIVAEKTINPETNRSYTVIRLHNLSLRLYYLAVIRRSKYLCYIDQPTIIIVMWFHLPS